MIKEESKKIKIGEFEFEINLPNVGEAMAIQSKKILLSGNTYREQVQTGTLSARYNLTLIDALSTFSVLIPDFIKPFGITTMADFSLKQSRDIVKTYKTEFFPWYEETMNIMFEGFEEDYKIDEETERDMTSQTQL